MNGGLHQRVMDGLMRRAGEFRELHHGHITMDANAAGLIATVVVELVQDEQHRLLEYTDSLKRLFIAANRDRRFAWRELRHENEQLVEANEARDHYHRFATMVGEIVRLFAEDIPSIDVETLLRDLPANLAAVKAERDRLRAENARLDALHAEARLERLVERDRAVADAAHTFVAARSRWHAEMERSNELPAEAFRQDYDDTLLALVDAVREAT